jgi:hypothetical protein
MGTALTVLMIDGKGVRRDMQPTATREPAPKRCVTKMGKPSDAYRSITIKGFKSIHSIEGLESRPINLLIGANCSQVRTAMDGKRY